MKTLSESECYELLNGGVVGRVGVTIDSKQVVLPVNYATDGHSVVIRVSAVGVLAINAPMAQVAFEVDQIDDTNHKGWSVMLQGIAHDVTDSVDETSENLRRLSTAPWAPGEKSCLLKITPQQISGRQLL